MERNSRMCSTLAIAQRCQRWAIPFALIVSLAASLVEYSTALAVPHPTHPLETDGAQTKYSVDPNPDVEGAGVESARPGLCRITDEISGRWVSNGSGELIPLQQICTNSAAWASYVASFEEELASIDPASDGVEAHRLSPDQEFWLRFRTIASAEALEYGRSLSIDAVVDYGQTLCPLLGSGLTMDEVRTAQIEVGLPADFDAAVNVAALHTYCPQHVNQIGR